MEQAFSTSKVIVEYSDPYDVYKLLAPGLIPRFPLRDLHWQSHAGPLRSIGSLHIELVPAGTDLASVLTPISSPNPRPHGADQSDAASTVDDGFQTASIGGRLTSPERRDSGSSTLRPPSIAPSISNVRRHQIPGLRRTPYLKLLLVRCDDNDTYKNHTRAEIREWVKSNTPPSQSSRKSISNAENHDAFEYLIVHVVIPNTVAATQPRVSGKASDSSTDLSTKNSSGSRWRGNSSSLLEKLRSDFNGTSKGSVDRIAQIRIGINDVPYDMLPRVVPAVPSGYADTEQDTENAWSELIGKFRSLILSSFDMRVTQYEEDIKERDGQRALPGWNFCTFFILKEGLARGFESVGLVEDALVGYDELSVGLDTLLQEQSSSRSTTPRAGSLLHYTADLEAIARRAVLQISAEQQDEEAVDLQSRELSRADHGDDIPISSIKKPYRDIILANNVSAFDFRCYIFARQISLLLRLGNAWSTREELLAKLKEQQDSVLYGGTSRPPPLDPTDERENLTMLAEICRRTLEFIPVVSQVMRKDIISALREDEVEVDVGPELSAVVDNMVASFAFSIAQQMLAQTSTKALPIPPTTLGSPDAHEPKSSIPEPKTMMHPARTSSLHIQRPVPRPPPSPGIFPGPGRRASVPEADVVQTQFLKIGLEELAARRAELYTLSRSILEEAGKKRGWTNGWALAPIIGDGGGAELQVISLDDENENQYSHPQPAPEAEAAAVSLAGIGNELLRTALSGKDDFYRLYETLTDKALQHYNVAGHFHSVQAHKTDLAVLKWHLHDYASAATHFIITTPFFGTSGWSLLELSMLIMYAKCVREVRRQDEYVKVVLKLLTMAAAAEKDRTKERRAVRIEPLKGSNYPESSVIIGFLEDLIATSASLNKEIRVPLASFITDMELEGTPAYDDGQDSFSLTLKLRSLLAEELKLDSAKMRLIMSGTNSPREIWVEGGEQAVLRPGHNRIQLKSNNIAEGVFEADRIILTAEKIVLHYEGDVAQTPSKAADVLKDPRVTLIQRASAFDIRLRSSKDIQLDKNNSLVLEVSSGWNEIQTCDIRIRPITGGLRLLTSEATISDAREPSKKPEGGNFSFQSIPAWDRFEITFPFTVEQDLTQVTLGVDVVFSTDRAKFVYSSTPSAPIALALGVNVQDVFKHDALLSRFTVSTATTSPLRLSKSELLSSEVFESSFGMRPSHPITVFMKQPASLLYKVSRKAGSSVASQSKKTMYLKLHYSVLTEEAEALVEESLRESLKDSPLWEYSRLVTTRVLARMRESMTPYDLEKATLLNELDISSLANVRWEAQFAGLSKPSSLSDHNVASTLADFVSGWQRHHPSLQLKQPDPAVVHPRSIVIPVDIPSVSVVHTADIRLQEEPGARVVAEPLGDPSAVCINQLLPAILHLKWTRIWDTAGQEQVAKGTAAEDLEFSYEVTAPAENWLLGGRRKGHFVIPALTPTGGSSSTPDTEADIPLLLVPLREGWLPYPSVEVREVRAGTANGGGEGDAAAGSIQGHCETDFRNLGETVHVVADRARVTLSLDASGPGGGPLVLESESLGLGGRIVA